jgi:hypothetical protein
MLTGRREDMPDKWAVEQANEQAGRQDRELGRYRHVKAGKQTAIRQEAR